MRSHLAWLVVLAMVAGLIALLAWNPLATPEPEPQPPSRGNQVRTAQDPTPHGSDDQAEQDRSVATPGSTDDAPAQPTVHGRVVNPGGRPVPGARVVALKGGDDEAIAEDVADESGRFEFTIERARTFDLAAVHASEGFAFRAGLVVDGTSLPAGDLVLQARELLTGRLVYPDGQAIAALAITVRSTGDGPRWSRDGAGQDKTITDSAGRFRFLGLASGSYVLDLLILPVRGTEKPTIELRTGPPDRETIVDLHRLRFRPSNADFLYHGWRAERGAEVQRAQQLGEGWGELLAAPDTMGAGSLPDCFVPRGSWWCVEYSLGDRWQQVLIHADPHRNETETEMQPQTVALDATLRVRLRPTAPPAPTRLEIARLQALSLRCKEKHEAAGRDGDDFLFRLPAGHYRVTLQPDPDHRARSAFFPIERVVQLRAGQETTLIEAPARGGRVSVTVHLPDNQRMRRLPGLEVTGVGADGAPIGLGPYQVEWQRDEFTWGFGAPAGQPFTCLRLLPLGRHELTVSADGFQSQRVAASIVREGEVTAIEVWLQR